MKFRNLAWGAAAFVLFACSASAQFTTIEGTVTGTDGKPVQGAVIQIHRTDIKWDSHTKTDKKGHYVHAGVPLGKFDITCEVDGKPVDKVTNYQTSMAERPPLDFDLRKSASQTASATQALVQQAMDTGQMSEELKKALTPEQQAQIEKQIAARADEIKKHNALNQAFNAGVTAMQAKQYDQAVPAFEKASETDPNQPAVWANLGEAYIQLSQSKTGAEHDDLVNKGLQAYEKSLTLKDDAGVRNNYALALATAGKFAEMQTELKKAAESDPANAYSKYFNLGALLTNHGQGEAAAQAFKMAIDAAPDNPANADSYYQYGLTLIGQASVAADGKITAPPGTAEAFQKYLQLAPDGKNAQSAKEMLGQLGATIDTNFKNPVKKKK